jgi:hypothetical protein
MRVSLYLSELEDYLAEIKEYITFLLVQDYNLIPYFKQGIDTMMDFNSRDAATLISNRLKESIHKSNYSEVTVSSVDIIGNKIKASFALDKSIFQVEALI